MAAWPNRFQPAVTASLSLRDGASRLALTHAGEEEKVRAFLEQFTICELSASIRARAVILRRKQSLKLPDAVVCATALEFGVELWTNDKTLAKVLAWRAVSLSAR